MKIGLIGLGVIGEPVAKGLLRAGYDLTISDLNQTSVDETVAAGAKAAANAEIGETCDVVLTMVPNSPQMKAVMLGEDGVAAHMKPDSVFIDMSSTNPVASNEITARLAKRDIEVPDTPVSGGESRTIDGTLSFMVGGKQEIFDQCKELLGAMGASVMRCGDVGTDNTTKLASQIIMACNIQTLSEALTLTRMADMDPELVFQIIRDGLAGSTIMNAEALMMTEGSDKPGFKIDPHIKDLSNALDCTYTVGPPLLMTATVQEILQWLHNNGCGQDGHNSVIGYYEKLTGIESL